MYQSVHMCMPAVSVHACHAAIMYKWVDVIVCMLQPYTGNLCVTAYVCMLQSCTSSVWLCAWCNHVLVHMCACCNHAPVHIIACSLDGLGKISMRAMQRGSGNIFMHFWMRIYPDWVNRMIAWKRWCLMRCCAHAWMHPAASGADFISPFSNVNACSIL